MERESMANLLPKKLNWNLGQDQWSAILNPIIKNPMNQMSILKSISLVTGTNVINHKLGRPLQGWIPTRVRAAATFYDQQDTNETPDLTLILVSSGNVVIDLSVF